MSQTIPAGLKREHVLEAIAELAQGIKHPFGKPTAYHLIYGGKDYAPKAVIGLASRRVLGRLLSPEEFSGGEAPGQANFVLRKLGFTVERKTNAADAVQEEGLAGSAWTEEEVKLLVADYFSMLKAELHGETFKKSSHRDVLAPKLNRRSAGSIEFKHQNVSGVLVELGLPYIEGYKPRGNYQNLLAQEVEAYMAAQPQLIEQMATAPALNPIQAKSIKGLQLDQIIVDPPERIILPKGVSKPWLSRKERKIDFAERDAANRHLGRLGEQFVLEAERHRLKQNGRDDLAKKVQWASQDVGDGLGFDILSFDAANESEQMLEVKTTGLGKFFPFYVTANEVRCSEDVPAQYQLFRVFNFGRDPRFYILHGSLRQSCQLEPVVYRAAI